jgi:hypothetical protein
VSAVLAVGLAAGLLTACTSTAGTAPLTALPSSTTDDGTPTFPSSTPSSAASVSTTAASVSTSASAAPVASTPASKTSTRPTPTTAATRTTPTVPTTRTTAAATTSTTHTRGSIQAAAGPGSTTAGLVPSAGLSPEQAADRQAIANAWVRFWTVFIDASKRPVAERKKLMAQVAVEPYLTDVLQGIEEGTARGEGLYGNVTHRFYWAPASPPSRHESIGDCMDTTQFGSYEVKTGDKLTKGYERDNNNVTFYKDDDGSWKVQQILVLDTPC